MTNPDNVGGLPELPEPIRMGLNDAIPFGGYYTADQMRAYGELCRAAPAGGAPICPECKAPGLLFECVACSHSNYPKDSAPAGGDVPTVLDALHYLRAAICETEAPECYWDITEAVDKWIADANVGKLTPKLDSAPAGSGEVEALVQKWRDESESGFDGDGNLSDTWTAQAKRACADELTALLRKLQQGADGWRPIESAPKEDGLKILGASNAPWTQDYYPVLVYEGYRHGSNKQYFGWQAPFDHDDRAPDPTYWMPLPAPPASQDQDGGKHG